MLALERAEAARPEDWQAVAARVAANEAEWRALLAGFTAEDVYADL